MVFKRRVKPSFVSRVRAAVLPKRGYRRGVEYLGHRMRRLPDTPHRIALGFACGVFSSFTPFFGLHIILAAVIARLLRSNIVAALIGTAAGNPLDLSADRPGGAGARAAHPRLRRPAARLPAGAGRLRRGPGGAARRDAEPGRARPQRLGQARPVLSRHPLAVPRGRAAAGAGRRRGELLSGAAARRRLPGAAAGADAGARAPAAGRAQTEADAARPRPYNPEASISAEGEAGT